MKINVFSLLIASGLMLTNLGANAYSGPDFNGDGKADLAQVWNSDGDLTFALQLSDGGSFTEKTWTNNLAEFDQTHRWFYADFNADGKSDTAVIRNDDGKASCDVYLSANLDSDKIKSALKKKTWSDQGGAFKYSDRWFTGDFNGDRKADLARFYNDGGKRSIEIYTSNGHSFEAPVKWAAGQGDYHADNVLLTGDFNNDRKSDFAVVMAGSKVNIEVHLSDGSKFTHAQWEKSSSPRLTSMKWLSGDFNNDGMTDIAKLWDDSDKVSIDVHLSSGKKFSKQSWLKQGSDFQREHKWFTGDFNGDSRQDVARLWNDEGEISVEAFEATSDSKFANRVLISKSMEYRDQNVYSVGDFNGDSRTDIAVLWGDKKKRRISVIESSKKGAKVDSYLKESLANYFDRHNLAHEVYGDKFYDFNELQGATPPEADLQSVLNSGADLQLVKNRTYHISNTLNYQASYQSIRTFDARFISDQAIMRMQIDQGDYDTMIDGNQQDYLHLENVTVDGNKYALPQRYRGKKQAQGAMVFFSHTEGVWVRRCVMYNSRTWSTCHVVESGDSHSHILEYNYILGGGVDPRGNGRSHDELGKVTGKYHWITWTDGLSISARETIARYNFILDTTDVGMVLFGAPGSHVHDNMIVNYSRSNHGGLNLVDDSAHRLLGDDPTFKPWKRYDYRNNIIENNRISAAGSRIMIGMPIGNRTWKNAQPAIFDFAGGVIRNNSIEGDAMGYGYVVDYVTNINFYGNTSNAKHSGKGRGSSENKNDPDPAMAFYYDPEHYTVAEGGKFEGDFVANTKPIEHLLFHNGTSLNGLGFHYYGYSQEEAEAIVKVSHWEMLGREPSKQELIDGKNWFLVDPKPETPINEASLNYADQFRAKLMKTPEFISKFGNVPEKNIHLFRTARWRDRVMANDDQAMIVSGNYPNPIKTYDDILAEMKFEKLKGMDAEIVSISPKLPALMKQGEVHTFSVKIKNTGKKTWLNTPENPRKIAFASVGDETAFSTTKVYLPEGVSVKSGDTHSFDVKLYTPPVAWTGEDSLTTSIPCNFRMIKESDGFFGQEMADYIGGKVHQVTVEKSNQPEPQPYYHSTFISQELQGNPQVNGIQPGAKFAVNLTFKNSGNYRSEPWSKNGDFHLGSENEKDNRHWGNNRIKLNDSILVYYGETVTFHAVLTAPKEEGEYNFQWQLVGKGWFGEMSENLVINVSKSAPKIQLLDSQFVSIIAPGLILKDKEFKADITFKNTGNVAWTSENAPKLGNLELLMDRTDEHNAVITSQYPAAAKGVENYRVFDNSSKTKYVTNHANAWVQHQFANGHKFNVTKYAVTSAPDEGAGPELLDNGSFEAGAEGWEMNKYSSIGKGIQSSGNDCLMMSSIEGKNSGNTTVTLKGLKPDTDYALSFWLKQEPNMQGAFVLDTDDVFDDTCQWVVNGGQPTNWTKYRGVFNTAKVQRNDPNPDHIKLRLRANRLVGTVYIDDVSIVEVSGGKALGDPKTWTLEASNDGKKWDIIDSRDGIDFPERSQRLEFAVSKPGEYEYYRFNAKNNSGNALQFGQLELLTQAYNSIWTGSGKLPIESTTVVKPGESYTFSLNINAPSVSGDYILRSRMFAAKATGEQWFGDYSEDYIVSVAEDMSPAGDSFYSDGRSKEVQSGAKARVSK